MKVLINRSDAIGDTVLTLPMAEAIKKKFPQAHVSFVVKTLTMPLFHQNPFVDELLDIEDPELRKKIKEAKFDAYLYVGGSHRPSFYSFLAGVPLRTGLKSKWPSYLFLNNGFRQRRSQALKHETEYNFELLSSLNITSKELFTGPKLYPSKEEIKQKLIILHPGMTGHTLNWPMKNYAALISLLIKKFGDEYQYMISHTPSDQKYVEVVQSHLSEEVKKKVELFDGSKKGLLDFIQRVNRASLFIGPSTGTTHIANALGVKVMAFYSPIKTQSAKRWGPFYQDENVTQLLVPNVQCEAVRDCMQKSCPNYECMGKVSPQVAFEKACFLLKS